MRRMAVLGAILGPLCMAALVRAQAAAPAPAKAAEYKPPEQTTVVKGTPPAGLEGRWLVAERVGIANGPGRAIAALWNITTKDGQLQLEDRIVTFPPDIQKAMEDANKDSNGTWVPTAAQVDQLRAAWDSLQPEGRGVTTITTDIFGPDGYDEEVKKDPKTAGARWIIRQTYEFEPGGARPIKQVNVAVATGDDGGVTTGDYTTVMVAAAPFPIPIKLDGSFRMVRLDQPASKGFLARILDFFRGCN